MNIPIEYRKQILEGFIDIFTRIASKEYQKRVWINGMGPDVDDFDDTVNDFFLECDSVLDNYKLFEMSETQYLILKNFTEKFKTFCDDNDWPPFFIDTPEWGEIVDMAQEVLRVFNYKKVRS